MKKRFEALRAADELRGLSPELYAKKAAGGYSASGSRVSRERTGFEFSIRAEDREPWYNASKIGFELADYGPMAALILARIQALDAEDRSHHP